MCVSVSISVTLSSSLSFLFCALPFDAPPLLSTCRSILRACATLGYLDVKASNAVEARQELDLRIGESLACNE